MTIKPESSGYTLVGCFKRIPRWKKSPLKIRIAPLRRRVALLQIRGSRERGRPTQADHYQVKFHVDCSGCLTRTRFWTRLSSAQRVSRYCKEFKIFEPRTPQQKCRSACTL